MNKRILQINLLRGIACLLVVIDHMFFSTKYFNIGAFGVGIFFLVSGFVIPISIKSSATPIKFIIRRMFRLYPVVITCLGFVFFYSIFIKPIYIRYEGFDLPNITFLQFIFTVTQIWDLTASPLYMPIFWTLVIEEKFYILCAILFAFNKDFKPAKFMIFAIVVLSLFLIGAFFANVYYHTLILRNVMFISFMLFGSLLYFSYNKLIANKEIAKYFLILFVIIIVTMVLQGKRVMMIEQVDWSIKYNSIIASYGLALVVFIFCFKQDSILLKMPKWLLKFVEFIALISFPLYAIHTEIWANIANRTNALFWFLLICFISFIIHKVIERPFITCGKKLTVAGKKLT